MIDAESHTLVDVAVDYYLNPWTSLLLAIIQAEGGRDAYIRAIQCSRPACATFEEALAWGCKTLRNLASNTPATIIVHKLGKDPWTGEASSRCLAVSPRYIEILGARWAPIGVANDPHGLNANWIKNVKAAYVDLTNIDAEEWDPPAERG